MTAKANIGVIGLAVMGSNLARNLASREGNSVAIFNRSFDKTAALVEAHPEANFIASETIDEFVASLQSPRTAIIMVQAGAGTDAVIDLLKERFSKGDIIVDGGNALFTDTIRREREVAALGINFGARESRVVRKVPFWDPRSCLVEPRRRTRPSARFLRPSQPLPRVSHASPTLVPMAPDTL